MDASDLISAENRDVELLRLFVEQTTAEVSKLQNDFERQEEIVDTFANDKDVGAVKAQKKADKIEERLIAAKSRQDAAYSRFSATVEQTSKTVASVVRSASGKAAEEASKPSDRKFLKRKLKEPDEWKDHKGKTHTVHLQMFTACKTMSAILWRLFDNFRDEAEANGEADVSIISKDVRLGELFSYSDLMDKIDDMSPRELFEYALNTVHEQSVVVYLRHHYSSEVVQAFSGDKLFLVDQSLPTQERIDAAIKRVQNMSASAKAAIAPPGAIRPKQDPTPPKAPKAPKGGWGRLLQQQMQMQPPSMPPGYGNFQQGQPKPGGALGGVQVCFNCGLPGHMAAACPKK